MSGGPPSTSGLSFPQPAGFGFFRRSAELNYSMVKVIGTAGAVRLSHSLGRHLRLESVLRTSLSKKWERRGYGILRNPNKKFFSVQEAMDKVFIAQLATKGKLMLWGAKVNSLIDKGQLWRLVTSSFLHANVGHLMVNCYSLNSVGPNVESLCGAKRFLSIYFASALASSAASYWFCKSPAVGASGAIFGLVGSVAMFVIRHRGTMKGGKDELRHIANVIFLNMAIGLMSRGIDNWGHLGGLVGGFVASWLLGPAWKFEYLAMDGRKVFVDKAPIRLLLNPKKGSSSIK